MQNQTITKHWYKFIPHIWEIPEDWKIVEMKNITTKITNWFVWKATDHYVEQGWITYIQWFNVSEYWFNMTWIKKVSIDFHTKNNKSELKEWDLITIQTWDVGVTWYVTKELEWTNCHALIISRFKKNIVNSFFYYYYFNSYLWKRQFNKIETWSTMKHLNCWDMEKLHLPLPKIEEQNKISDIFNSMDKSIIYLKDIIKKTDIRNKWIKQKLLSWNIRLPWFNKKWSNISLDKIGYIPKKDAVKEIIDEKLLTVKLHWKWICFNNDIPVISSTWRPYYIRNYWEILIWRQNFHNWWVWLVTSEFSWNICSNAITSYMVNKQYSIEFILNLFMSKFFYNRIEIFMSWTGQKELSEKQFLKLKINIPDIEEQKAISNVLNKANNQLIEYKEKLEKLELLKKWLEQQLLTGKTRVKV